MTTTTTHPSLPPHAQDASPSVESYNTQIDLLLTRYLSLLDEYTTLRSSLSSLQVDMYQNLARANFAAERGVRYGKDYFDERMVAGRRVRVSSRNGERVGGEGTEGEMNKVEDEEVMEWRVVKVDEDGNEVMTEKEEGEKNGWNEAGKEEDTQQRDGQEEEHDQDSQDAKESTDRQQQDSTPEKDDDSEAPEETVEEKKARLKKIRNDPLRWFGLLTPLPLRLAQTQAIQAVEDIIPRLVTVNAEMQQVEIEVRRARKRREKAEKAAKGTKVTAE
ncbi:hypothetical protein B0T20DRAFT_160291 [Sordaria brevicollis]|uniref:Vacuolar ATPase assembly protein VMA22 n=1 Tax=Sordaria brevicollis TaxID=83679 RepID=A0AAE0PJN2_SORBR|nr:hypothetical protein B0T20DRAFT_160291 [Sordaria brevicollis]